MDTTLFVAVLVPWVFWGTLMGLLFAAGRSWINLVLIPIGITGVIVVGASLSSAGHALWASVILHLVLLVVLLGSYVSFVLAERGKNGQR